MKNVSTYHSRRPHRAGLKTLPVRLIWPRSTANTPIWQVTLDSSSTVVLMVPRVRFRSAPGQGSPWALSTERMVKYIANSAAKNISSEDSQTMVPTLTRFGRLVGDRGGVCVADAVATGSLLRHRVGERWATPGRWPAPWRASCASAARSPRPDPWTHLPGPG